MDEKSIADPNNVRVMNLKETQQQKDERYMRAAIEAARIAEENGDVPIGAAIGKQAGLFGVR